MPSGWAIPSEHCRREQADGLENLARATTSDAVCGLGRADAHERYARMRAASLQQRTYLLQTEQRGRYMVVR